MAAKTQISIELDRRRKALRSVRALLNRNEDQILWTLLRFVGDESNSYQISMVELANELHCSDTTARRAMRSLKRMGFVASSPCIGVDGIEANEYTILWGSISDSGKSGERIDDAAEIEAGESHCQRNSKGRWTTSEEMVTDLLEVAVDDQRELFGTEYAGSVKLTEPVRSERPNRSGQIDRTGQVNLTEPSISPLSLSSKTPSPPPSANAKPRPTLVDAEWLVVVDELILFGIWKETAHKCAANARERGLTPQTVSDLVRFAARKVIERTVDGRPVAQWAMPPQDDLDGARPPQNAIYLWGPPMLVYRIGKHEPAWGIASNWLVNVKRKADYEQAQSRLPSPSSAANAAGQSAPKADEVAAKAKAFHAETARLEADHADAIAALTIGQAIELLPSFLRRSQGTADPRFGRYRPHFLRIFAASLVPQSSSINSEHQ